ncbi:MAG: hypothetical protein ACI828_002590 [Flavobacteriales bacterium]|jgi:hypothetical protein
MRQAIYLFAILLFICSCQKDDDGAVMPVCEITPSPCDYQLQFHPFQDTCYELPPLPDWPPSTISGDSYSLPILSPSNADEFLYFKSDSVVNSMRTSYLRKVNFCTAEQTLIETDFDVSGQGLPIWGEKDWVVFTSFSNNQLWKMKSNGDSLQQITDFPNIVRHPVWINEGENIIAITKLEGDPFGLRYVFNTEGEIVDTVGTNFHTQSNHWNGKLATTWTVSGDIVLGYYDINQDELHPVPNLILEDFVKEIRWLDEENIVWVDPIIGLYRVNIQTGEVTLLVENCDNRKVSRATTSPFHNGMIYMTESHKRLIEDSTMYYGKTRIYKLDAFTGEQWLVDLED